MRRDALLDWWRDARLTLRRYARDVLAMYYGTRDARVPLRARLVPILPILYLLMPADLIPDVFPLIGWVDDLAMLPLAAYLADRLTPPALAAHLRGRADETLVRRWPQMRLYLAAFVISWCLVAAIGGHLLLLGPGRDVPDHVMIERIVTGRLGTSVPSPDAP